MYWYKLPFHFYFISDMCSCKKFKCRTFKIRCFKIVYIYFQIRAWYTISLFIYLLLFCFSFLIRMLNRVIILIDLKKKRKIWYPIPSFCYYSPPPLLPWSFVLTYNTLKYLGLFYKQKISNCITAISLLSIIKCFCFVSYTIQRISNNVPSLYLVH